MKKNNFWNREREREREREKKKKLIHKTTVIVYIYSNNVFLHKFTWFDDVSELCAWLAKMWSLYYFKLVGASALMKRRS